MTKRKERSKSNFYFEVSHCLYFVLR